MRKNNSYSEKPFNENLENPCKRGNVSILSHINLLLFFLISVMLRMYKGQTSQLAITCSKLTIETLE